MTLDRYLLRLWVGPFLGGLLVVFVVVVLARALKLLSNFTGNIEACTLIGNLLVMTMPVFLLQIIPIAFFLALQNTVSSLQQSSELDALNASGLSYSRIFRVFFIVGAILWAALSYISMVLTPESQLEFNNILAKAYAMKGEAIGFSPQRFTGGLNGISVYVDGKDELGTYHGVILDDHRQDASIIYTAKSAHFNKQGNFLRLELKNGVRMEGKGADQRILFFKQYRVSIPLPALNRRSLHSADHVTMMTMPELWRSLLSNHAGAAAEWNRRILLPTTVFVLLFFTLPFSLSQKRSGKATSFISGVILLLAVYNLQLVLYQQVNQGALVSWNMWLGQGMVLGLGLWLSKRASDGHLLDPLAFLNRLRWKSSQTI